MNGDGRLDLVVANQLTNDVSVLLGNGDGTLQPEAYYPFGSEPYFVVVGDLNGDGRPDVATANHGGGTVSVRFGTGSGTLLPATSYAAGSGPICIAIGDFNGDGRADLAVVLQYGNAVAILLGNPAPSAGTFGLPSLITLGGGPTAAAVADFDGDGRADLAVTNFDTDSVWVLRGNGNGTFQSPAGYAVGGSPRAIAVGDLNGDGRPDIATANYTGNSTSVLLANTSGTFLPTATYTTGNGTHSIAIGDLNGDGQPDLAVANASSNTMSILGGRFPPYAGMFDAPLNWGVGNGPVSVVIGNFNGDGRPDIAVANGLNDSVSMLLSLGTYAAIVQQPTRASVLSGQSASFFVVASGVGLGYQWRRDGVPLSNSGAVSGAKTATLTINPVTLADSGATFDCVLYGTCRSITSRPAGLSVAPRCPADFNQSGAISVQDVFDFLGAYFAGCP